MPTTVDLEVAMAPLTVIRAVYISGAEWWQPGGGHPAGTASGVAQAASAVDRGHFSHPQSPGPCRTFNELVPWTPGWGQKLGGGENGTGRDLRSDGAAANGSGYPSPWHHGGTRSRGCISRQATLTFIRDPVDGPWGSSVWNTPVRRAERPCSSRC
jgi:hypothetical protein